MAVACPQHKSSPGRAASPNSTYAKASATEEVAPAFVYFASEAVSSYVTGEVLTLLGGETTAG
jgi:NAD(P)-dependent dehydrogenase (short-subunit alcohol dehydrogenase family)